MTYDDYKNDVKIYLMMLNKFNDPDYMMKENDDEIMYGYDNGISPYDIASQIAADELYYSDDCIK